MPRLAERAVTRAATADGYVLTFAAGSENLLAIRRTIDAERQCGRWLTFSVVARALTGGPIGPAHPDRETRGSLPQSKSRTRDGLDGFQARTRYRSPSPMLRAIPRRSRCRQNRNRRSQAGRRRVVELEVDAELRRHPSGLADGSGSRGAAYHTLRPRASSIFGGGQCLHPGGLAISTGRIGFKSTPCGDRIEIDVDVSSYPAVGRGDATRQVDVPHAERHRRVRHVDDVQPEAVGLQRILAGADGVAPDAVLERAADELLRRPAGRLRVEAAQQRHVAVVKANMMLIVTTPHGPFPLARETKAAALQTVDDFVARDRRGVLLTYPMTRPLVMSATARLLRSHAHVNETLGFERRLSRRPQTSRLRMPS